MSEKFTFTLTEDDLRAAYALSVKRPAVEWIGSVLLIGILTGIAITAMDPCNDVNHTIKVIGEMILLIGFIMLIIGIILRIWWIPRFARKIYRQQKELHLETTIWWDDEKLYSSNAQTQRQFAFADIEKWRSDEKFLLIYPSDHQFDFLPTRIFNHPSDRAELIRRLQDAGVPGKAQS